MRPLLALSVASLILGGLWLYMTFRPQPALAIAEPETAAEGRVDIELTLTFDAGPDAFALDVTDAPTLLVQLRGKDVLRRTDPILAGAQLRVEAVSGLVTGINEFFVQATPQDTAAPVARAVRVRILRNGYPMAEQTLWSEPGELVQGVVVVEIPTWSGVPQASTRRPASPHPIAAREAHGA